MPTPALYVPLLGADFPSRVTALFDEAAPGDTIDIIVFDWRWPPSVEGSALAKFNRALIEARKRGALVRCIVNSGDVAQRLRLHNIESKIITSSRMVHTKMILFGSRLLVIGSHNFTQGAFTSNYEASIGIDLENEQNAYSDYFKFLWAL